MDEKTFSNGSAYADLDNDGDLDLVVNNINDPASIFENTLDKKRNYIRVIPVADQAGVTSLNTKVCIDVAGTQQYFEITSVRGMYSTSEYVAHFGLGNKAKVDKIIVEWPDGKRNILKNQKANRVLKVRYSKASELEIDPSKNSDQLFKNVTNEIGLVIKHNENKFDDFSRQLMLPHKFSDRGPCFAIGDVNGDGLEDIFMGGSANSEGRLFKQNVDGSFGILPFADLKIDRKSEDIDALFFDVDNDDDLDLYIASGGNEFRAGAKEYQDRLYINDGSGKLSKSIDRLPKLFTSAGRIVPEDYDQDGDVDLLITGKHKPWEYPSPTSTLLLENDNGRFEDITNKKAKDLLNIGMVHDAKWIDIDNDGLLDLALAGEWMPFTIFKNDGTRFYNITDDAGLANTTGWWFCIDAADIDKDGDTDFVLGNLGWNYEYKASERKPFHIFYYDFDNNGSGDLVLAKYEGEKLYPVRERNRSVQQVPLLGEKIKTYHEFAKADIYEIYGEPNLKNALQYDAKVFSNSYVENLGNGKFQLHDLPKPAQLSSINDIIIDDFNNDGFDDLLVVGNLYGAEVETVRIDAGNGLLMLGNGKGDFLPIKARESGILLPFDVKRLKKFNYQGDEVIVVGCNNDYYQFIKLDEKSGFPVTNQLSN